MPYSLVNVSALGYDLARLPHGTQAAGVLRAALSCGPEELLRLSARHPGSERDARWDRAMRRPSSEGVRATLSLAGRAVERAAAGDRGASTSLLGRLERAALGDLTALDLLVRRDILDWTWLRSGDLAVQDPDFALACDVLCDAAASAYCSRHLDERTRRTMASPFLAARVERAGPTGHAALDDLLDAVAASDEDARESWRRTVATTRPDGRAWAPAMHQATWALHLSDRLRLGADAQLAAVAAFAAGGFGVRDAAYGVWNALSGVAQATVARDLLPDRDHAVLTDVWARVQGPRGPRTP